MTRKTLGFDRNQTSSREFEEALFLDGTALFQASKTLYPDDSLNYQAARDILYEKAGWAGSGSAGARSVYVMWTSAVDDNAGQARFLDFVETKLQWQVRRSRPADSYMVDPSTNISLGSNPHATQRLMRFDAQIAFAMGRLAETHEFMLVSDSFALADPLIRAMEISGTEAYLAFFGRALDGRWLRVIRSTPKLHFIDLDDFSEELFGVSSHSSTSGILEKDKSLIF